MSGARPGRLTYRERAGVRIMANATAAPASCYRQEKTRLALLASPGGDRAGYLIRVAERYRLLLDARS